MATTSLRRGRCQWLWSSSRSISRPSRNRITIRATFARSRTSPELALKSNTPVAPSPRMKPASTNRTASESMLRRARPDSSAPSTSSPPITAAPVWNEVTCVASHTAPMASERGHLKVFIGMAPGVGKTYRMLQEGVAEAASGRDVVIGYLEPHGRAETLAQAEGLEVVPRRTVVRRGLQLEEMDLPAVLARAPELCLIDELAHTNAPGLEHEKRYEDVRDALEAGIDVYSTVNVQHLESLNDQIAEATGTRVRETNPDD